MRAMQGGEEKLLMVTIIYEIQPDNLKMQYQIRIRIYFIFHTDRVEKSSCISIPIGQKGCRIIKKQEVS